MWTRSLPQSINPRAVLCTVLQKMRLPLSVNMPRRKRRREAKDGITIPEMHNIVEGALDKVNPAVAKSYRDYRNYKQDFIHMMDEVYTKSQSIRYIGDKSNANTDSALVATKRSLIFNELNKELYRKFFMNRDELQACKDGYIYIHDQSAAWIR